LISVAVEPGEKALTAAKIADFIRRIFLASGARTVVDD